MRLHRATHLILALLLAAGLGVCANFASAVQSTAKKKPVTRKPASSKSTAAHKPAANTSAKSKTAKSTKSSKRSRGAASSRNRGQKAPTSDRITEIQQALAKNGSYTGAPNGKWDDSTTDAMRKFQQSHGLNPSGKLDAKTLQQLGLGSQTAGVAPPMPPVSSTSRLSKEVPTERRQ